MIGIILLIGIVKKNAIMMIDFAIDAERTSNLPPADAIYQACLLRFRPIMMTTMAALLGALPLALGSGHRRRAAPPARHHHRRRPDRLPAPHALHHAGRLPLPRAAADVGWAPAAAPVPDPTLGRSAELKRAGVLQARSEPCAQHTFFDRRERNAAKAPRGSPLRLAVGSPAACPAAPATRRSPSNRRSGAAVPVASPWSSRRPCPLQIQAIGTVEAYTVVSVKAQVGGELHARPLQGRRRTSSKGELLFTIDPRPFEAALAQAQANLAKDHGPGAAGAGGARARPARSEPDPGRAGARRGPGQERRGRGRRAIRNCLSAG